MPCTVDSLRAGIGAIAAALEVEHERLSTLDGRIGDGDLGITLIKAFRELEKLRDGLPDDVGQALMQSAATVAKVSSSSFGTLLATALIAAGKASKGTTEIAWAEMPAQLDRAREAMSARGKAGLGDKTVLDTMAAAARAGEGTVDGRDMQAAMLAAVDVAIESFRDKPSRVGRARIFGDRTIGLDDPGMIAFRVMLAALPTA